MKGEEAVTNYLFRLKSQPLINPLGKPSSNFAHLSITNSQKLLKLKLMILKKLLEDHFQMHLENDLWYK
jgi:hypothetical protein